MSIEIPAELLLPSVEELEERTVKDLAIKRKIRKRHGKKERYAIKQEKEAEKLKNMTGELCKSNQYADNSANSLSSLFVQKENPKFSLNSINIGSTANSAFRPTLRASLKGSINGVLKNTVLPKPAESNAAQIRKRGRPPKLKPI